MAFPIIALFEYTSWQGKVLHILYFVFRNRLSTSEQRNAAMCLFKVILVSLGMKLKCRPDPFNTWQSCPCHPARLLPAWKAATQGTF